VCVDRPVRRRDIRQTSPVAGRHGRFGTAQSCDSFVACRDWPLEKARRGHATSDRQVFESLPSSECRKSAAYMYCACGMSRLATACSAHGVFQARKALHNGASRFCSMKGEERRENWARSTSGASVRYPQFRSIPVATTLKVHGPGSQLPFLSFPFLLTPPRLLCSCPVQVRATPLPFFLSTA
jgi:hypothetical protein